MFHTQGGGGLRPVLDRFSLQFERSFASNPDCMAVRPCPSTPMASANRSNWVSERRKVPRRYTNACFPSEVTPNCRAKPREFTRKSVR